MRTVQVIPIVVRSLGSVTKNLDKWLEKLNSFLFDCVYDSLNSTLISRQ